MNANVLTQPLIPVTDGAESTITVRTYCGQITIKEDPSSAGWPRSYYIRGATQGSVQHYQSQGTQCNISGPFIPGYVVGTVELTAAGGDSSLFQIMELP